MWWRHKRASGLRFVAKQGDVRRKTWGDFEDPVETEAAIGVEECGDKPAAEWVEAPPFFTFGAFYFHVWLIVFSLFPSPPPQALPRKHTISIVLPSEPHQSVLEFSPSKKKEV